MGFALEQSDKNQYYLVFTPNLLEKWQLSSDVPKISFNNPENIVVVNDNIITETTDKGIIYKQAVKFKDNVMLTGKISYSLNGAADKILERETSFAFNQKGEVIIYQNRASWWIGSVVALFALILLSLVWKGNKSVFE